MRKRQCKVCNEGNWLSYDDCGKVIDKEISVGRLPRKGNEIVPISIFTVECTRCGRIWMYRKKKK